MNSETIIGLIVLFAAGLLAFYKKISGVTTPGNAGPGNSSPGAGAGGSGDISAAPNNVARWENIARTYAGFYNLPWRVILAQIWTESAGNPDAVGGAGELGLMQLKQIAADDVAQNGYDLPWDWFTNAESNIATGAAFLDLQRRRTGTVREALKAYNQGEQGAKNNPGLANAYADKVLNRARQIGYSG